MNQLPILSGNTDSKPAAASAGASAKGDVTGDGTPFGTLLAQQLDEKNDKLQRLKENGLLAAARLQAMPDQRGELLRKLHETDDTIPAPGDQSPYYGAELLATLPVPPGVDEARAQSRGGENQDARPDIGATQKISLPRADDEHGKPALKADAALLPRKEAAAPGASPLPTAAVAMAADSRIAASPSASNQEATAPVTLLATPATLTPPAATPPGTSLPTVVSTPFSHPQWTNDFSQKITWLTSHQLQHAELHLNPPQLGPIDVSLKLDTDQATLQFASPHAAVREAIEQSIPKLREMLADNGIMLGGTTVSDQSRHQQHSESGHPSPAGFDIRPAEAVGTAATSLPARSRPHDGLVDTFV